MSEQREVFHPYAFILQPYGCRVAQWQEPVSYKDKVAGSSPAVASA